MRVVLLALFLAACARNPAGTRCELVCKTEVKCAERLELTEVSYSSCVEACSELEREAATAKLVDEHIRCVNAAATCLAAMDCP